MEFIRKHTSLFRGLTSVFVALLDKVKYKVKYKLKDKVRNKLKACG